jgi:hypothetical protein
LIAGRAAAQIAQRGPGVRTLPLSALAKLSVIAVEVALGLAVVGATLLVH